MTVDKLSPTRTMIAWAIFPTTFAGSLAVSVTAMSLGMNPQMAVSLAMVGAAIFIALAEWVQPHAKIWLESHGDVPTDVAHLVFSTVCIPLLFSVLLYTMLLVTAVAITDWIGAPAWPHSWPLVVQLGLALLVGELAQYWWHRCAHENKWLWRFHAAHHSSPRLYWLNSCRFHPVDSLAQYTLEVAPLVLLGCGPQILALFTLTTAVIGMFQHANIELRAGPLNWIFSMTELHRWHHSRDTRRGNANYGANLIVWDILFGTRFHPQKHKHDPTDVGLAEMDQFPQHYFGQLVAPFRWRQRKWTEDPDILTEN